MYSCTVVNTSNKFHWFFYDVHNMLLECQALPCQCWIDFCEIWNWGISHTFVNILQCWLKVDKSNVHTEPEDTHSAHTHTHTHLECNLLHVCLCEECVYDMLWRKIESHFMSSAFLSVDGLFLKWLYQNCYIVCTLSSLFNLFES